nr:TonB-dependent receptor [Paraflavitalea speifideiaquila]
MKYTFLFLLISGLATNLTAQQTSTPDSVTALQAVMVKAYEQNRQLKEVSGAINYIGKSQLERFNNTSLLPAFNTTPGVHMEERSPGSFRLNVRGSTLRSPFGVRNIKVYWNGIPFTDPGGSTYLNQLSYYNINSIEVIKGPAGSLYGAGTGGAVLLNSQPESWTPGAEMSYLYGSYSLHNLNVQVRLGSEENRNTFGYTHQTSDGYRDHTNMRRDVATWETRLKINDKQTLQASVLYGDLYYETPGGLTRAEYTSNPRGARPNADALQAAIRQQTFLASLSHTYQLTEQLENNSVVYGAFSQIRNPTFRNYEKEWNLILVAALFSIGYSHSIMHNLSCLGEPKPNAGSSIPKPFRINRGAPIRYKPMMISIAGSTPCLYKLACACPATGIWMRA